MSTDNKAADAPAARGKGSEKYKKNVELWSTVKVETAKPQRIGVAYEVPLPVIGALVADNRKHAEPDNFEITPLESEDGQLLIRVSFTYQPS